MEFSQQVIDLAARLGKTPAEVAPLVGVAVPPPVAQVEQHIPVTATTGSPTTQITVEMKPPQPEPQTTLAEIALLADVLRVPVMSEAEMQLHEEVYGAMLTLVVKLSPTLAARLEDDSTEGDTDAGEGSEVVQPSGAIRKPRGRAAKRRVRKEVGVVEGAV